MKKLLFYIPAILFSLFYGAAALNGLRAISPIMAVWLALWFASGLILNKGHAWGCFLGALPAIQFIYMGTQETGQIISETPIGIVLFVFYVFCGYLVYRKHKRLSDNS